MLTSDESGQKYINDYRANFYIDNGFVIFEVNCFFKFMKDITSVRRSDWVISFIFGMLASYLIFGK